MNLLAHLLLSGPQPEVRLGNVLGDVIKGSLEAQAGALSPRILAGAALHRRIDSFTDSHAIPRRSRALIAPEWHRFSGVLVDVFYDHALCRNWATLHPAQPLQAFLAEAYAQFTTHAHLLPADYQEIVRYMIQGNWLGSYATQAGIELTLRRMSHRLRRRRIHLSSAAALLPEIYPALEADFLAWWPVLVDHVRAFPYPEPAP